MFVCFNFYNNFGFSDHILVDFNITVKEQEVLSHEIACVLTVLTYLLKGKTRYLYTSSVSIRGHW